LNDTTRFLAVVAVIALALSIPPLRLDRAGESGLWTKARLRLRRWRESRRWSEFLGRYGVPIVFVAVLALCLAGTLRGRYPEPRIHDEFAYLLAADTFAHGRLTNPTHPQWQHLESLHIIWQPTYTSKYPPGQGLALAFSTVLFGEPIFGVWLIVAAAAAAIYWMLQAWFTPGWALAGTLIPTTQMLLLWTDNYWGGGLPALGGALLFGSLARLLGDPRPRYGALLGVGVGMLALTRPFFGLLASLPAAAVIVVWALRLRRSEQGGVAVRSLIPTALVLVAVFAFTGLHNYRTTGDALTMPHQLYKRTYGIVGEFAFLPKRPEPAYRHPEVRDFHLNYMLAGYERVRRRLGFNGHNLNKLKRLLDLLVGIPMALPLIFGLRYGFRKEPWIRFSVLVCVSAAAGSLVVIHYLPHYLAPVLAIAVLPSVYGMRYLWAWKWRGRPAGRRIVIGLLLIPLLTLAPWIRAWAFYGAPELSDRGQVAERLEKLPGDHLVIVRYGPDHSPHKEWVYNSADPDGSRIVWAREMGPARNEELFDYFRDRQIWVVDADEGASTLRPYPR
jgi:hypothetical protein